MNSKREYSACDTSAVHERITLKDDELSSHQQVTYTHRVGQTKLQASNKNVILCDFSKEFPDCRYFQT